MEILWVALISCSLISCHNVKDSGVLNGTMIHKEVNEAFELKFEACHSCGYHWFMAPVDSTKILLISQKSEPVNKEPGMVGGNAIETWTFTGLKPGKYLLIFYYKRPWLEETQKTEKIRVIIMNHRSS